MRRSTGVLVVLLLVAACGRSGPTASDTLLIYTSVTQDTVDAVVAGFRVANPEVTVSVFRAPTGELNARIAADRRTGGLRADVLWLTDPLSMQQFDAEGLLVGSDPETTAIPDEFQEERYWGSRILNLVIVRHPTAPPIASWSDLIAAATAGGVALPDPALAGSAFAAIAYFILEPEYGLDFLGDLAAAGATVVGAPGDVVTGVAEGQFAAGITLDTIAAAAVAKGSPIEIVWPEPGAIAFYSPIAVSRDTAAAHAFVTYTLGLNAQLDIAGTGWQPAHTDVPWDRGGPAVTVDWRLAHDRQDEFLDAFRHLFGG